MVGVRVAAIQAVAQKHHIPHRQQVCAGCKGLIQHKACPADTCTILQLKGVDRIRLIGGVADVQGGCQQGEQVVQEQVAGACTDVQEGDAGAAS